MNNVHKLEKNDRVQNPKTGEQGLVLKAEHDLIEYKYFIKWDQRSHPNWETDRDVRFLPRNGMDLFPKGDRVEIKITGRKGTVIDDNLKVMWDDGEWSYPLPENIRHERATVVAKDLITEEDLFDALEKIVKSEANTPSASAFAVEVYKVLEDLTKNHRKG